jgi:hypothetical protein
MRHRHVRTRERATLTFTHRPMHAYKNLVTLYTTPDLIVIDAARFAYVPPRYALTFQCGRYDE